MYRVLKNIAFDGQRRRKIELLRTDSALTPEGMLDFSPEARIECEEAVRHLLSRVHEIANLLDKNRSGDSTASASGTVTGTRN
jgi:hypothetical protein